MSPRPHRPEPLAGKPPLRCSGCGYEIRSYRRLPPCPMCREQSWEPAPWRPFTREKLGMSDRVELSRYAIRRGLVEP